MEAHNVVRHVVLVLRLDQHLVENDINGLRQTGDTHHHTVCIRVVVVPAFIMARFHLSGLEDINTGVEAPDTISLEGRHHDYDAPGLLPNSRTSAQFNGDLEDPSLSSTHHQRAVSPLHSLSISIYLRYSLPPSDLHFSDPLDARCHAGMLRQAGLQWTLSGDHVRPVVHRHLRHAKHRLQATLQRG